jgi:hypothetical protein
MFRTSTKFPSGATLSWTHDCSAQTTQITFSMPTMGWMAFALIAESKLSGQYMASSDIYQFNINGDAANRHGQDTSNGLPSKTTEGSIVCFREMLLSIVDDVVDQSTTHSRRS